MLFCAGLFFFHREGLLQYKFLVSSLETDANWNGNIK